MEELFKQSFQFAKIKLFKNYSDIQNKCVIHDSDPPTSGLPGNGIIDNEVSGIDPFDDIAHARKYTVSAKVTDTSCQPTENLLLYQKNSKQFFYTTNPTDSYIDHSRSDQPTVLIDVIKLVNVKPINVHNHWDSDFFEITKDAQIKRHYNNPFAWIEIYKTERWIKQDGDKIKIKYFHQVKSRRAGSKYYRVRTDSVTVTFDLVKGNFLCVTYESNGSRRRKTKKHFYSNSFLSLETSLPTIFKIKERDLSQKSPLHGLFIEEFKDIPFMTALIIELGINPYNVSFDKYDTYNVGMKENDAYIKKFVIGWMGRFVELKRIKLPDNGYRLLRVLYPTEKYLKRNERKLVAAILDRLGILSNFTVKILHEYPDLDIRTLVRLCHIFGDGFSRYIGNVNPRFFKDSSRYNDGNIGIRHIIVEQIMFFDYPITEKEKENIVHIINDMYESTPSASTTIVGEFYDHLGMMDRLRVYYPELSLTVRKWSTFRTEHATLSALERNIKKGYSTHNIFPQHIINYIEKPIEVLISPVGFKYEDFNELSTLPKPQKVLYQPVLLRTSEDYVEEGGHMHHCVAGYVEHDRSIIVSLRCGDERVTCEFLTHNKKCGQARYVLNQNPPKHFEEPLQRLYERISHTPESIKPIERRRVPLLINGKPINVEKMATEEAGEIDWLAI